MSRRELIYLTLKGLVVWLLLSGLVWYGGFYLGQGLLPLINTVIMTMNTDISPSLRLVISGEDVSIELSAWVLRPIYLNANHFIPVGTELKSSTHLLHNLVPFVIEGTLLLVWPQEQRSRYALVIMFGLLTAIGVILATLPALLLGQLEISFQQTAMSGNKPRAMPYFADWMVFCELGGRWLLAVIAAWLSIRLERVVASFAQAKNNQNRCIYSHSFHRLR
jgi:hypothetical protein